MWTVMQTLAEQVSTVSGIRSWRLKPDTSLHSWIPWCNNTQGSSELQPLSQVLVSVHWARFLRGEGPGMHFMPDLCCTLSHVSVLSVVEPRQLFCPMAAPLIQFCLLKSTGKE